MHGKSCTGNLKNLCLEIEQRRPLIGAYLRLVALVAIVKSLHAMILVVACCVRTLRIAVRPSAIWEGAHRLRARCRKGALHLRLTPDAALPVSRTYTESLVR